MHRREGRGAAAQYGVLDDVDLVTITFSKTGYLDQVHQVQLDVGGPNPADAVDAQLRTALVTVKGTISMANKTPAKMNGPVYFHR